MVAIRVWSTPLEGGGLRLARRASALFQQKPQMLDGAFGVSAEVRGIQKERPHPAAQRAAEGVKQRGSRGGNDPGDPGNRWSQFQKLRPKGQQAAIPLLRRPPSKRDHRFFIEHPHSGYDACQEQEAEKHSSKQEQGKKHFLKVEDPRSEDDQEPAHRYQRTFLSLCRHCSLFLRHSQLLRCSKPGSGGVWPARHSEFVQKPCSTAAARIGVAWEP